MLNATIPQNRDEENVLNAITSFFYKFKIGNLLRKYNAHKEKGIPILQIFKYKLCNVFSDRSMYMQKKTGSFKETFSKNAFYRFFKRCFYNRSPVYNFLAKIAQTYTIVYNEFIPKHLHKGGLYDEFIIHFI